MDDDKKVKGQTSFGTFYSRWGVKGSNEISDGLTAVYHYEQGISLGNARLGQDKDKNNTGRLSYVGLSGGFGTLTMGRLESAGTNSVGAITNNGWFYTDSQVPGKESHMVSYSATAGDFSVQAGVQMDPGRKDNSVDLTHVGASFNAGIAKFALYSKELKMDSGGTPDFGATAAKPDHTDGNSKARITAAAVEVEFGGVTAHVGSTQKSVWDPVDLNGDNAANEEAGHVARPKVKKKYLHYGVRGSFGDSGINYLLSITNTEEETAKKAASTETVVKEKGEKTKPMVLGLSKSLGGGASVVFEYLDPDEKDSAKMTALALAVNF